MSWAKDETGPKPIEATNPANALLTITFIRFDPFCPAAPRPRPDHQGKTKRVTAFYFDSNMFRICEMTFWLPLCFIGHTHLADLNLPFSLPRPLAIVGKAGHFVAFDGSHRADPSCRIRLCGTSWLSFYDSRAS
ncbi:hypothetical protein ACWTU6_26935 [Mesorhizobium sp. BHbsci]